MKKLLAALLCFGVFGAAVSAQSTRATRPRIVVTPTAVPNDAPPASNNPTRKPVLKGATASGAQTATTDVAKEAEIGDEDNEVIRVETNLVTIPVSVLDRDGRFVSGLQRQDFKIFENGVEQQIDNFAATEQPFTVVLLLDVSPSTAYQINEIHDAAISFVNQLRRDDKVIVVSFDEKIHVLSPPTSNRTVLQNAIMQAEFGNGTNLYDAVDDIISRQLNRVEGRKAVVLFTDGVDNVSRRATYQSTVRETQENGILFYPIRYDTYRDNGGNSQSNNPFPNRRRNGGGGKTPVWAQILGGILSGDDDDITIGGNPRNGGASRSEYETGRRYLNELAQNSGGRMFEANQNSNLDQAFSGIAEELRRQYSIGYYPESAGNKGDRKQIKVRVKRPNLAVRAKSSYIVGETDKKLAGK